MQRVYHVVFANTLQTHERATHAQTAVANGVRIKVAVRRSICSADLFNSIPRKRDAAPKVDRPFQIAAHQCLTARGNLLIHNC
jgi:hypothetical protein